jgi:hypothetical protein
MIGMLTGTRPDCRPHYISISLAFEQAETTEKKSSGMAGWCRSQIFYVNSLNVIFDTL